jgi:alpha-N-acetylglucosaminidase
MSAVSNEPSRRRTRLLAALALWSAGALLASGARAAPPFDTRPVAAALARLLPHQAAQLELRTLDSADGHERLRISGVAGRVRIEGSTPSALFFGANWYLKYVAHLHFSESGDQTDAAAALPVPAVPIEMETPYPWRYALNENVDGYTAPYWDFPHWQREIEIGRASCRERV